MSVDMNRSGGSRNYSQDQMESNQNSRTNNDPNAQTMAELSQGRHSIVNLTDALDAGSAMDK